MKRKLSPMKIDDLAGFGVTFIKIYQNTRDCLSWAILIMNITSDTCECECGFSCMNYVKRMSYIQ